MTRIIHVHIFKNAGTTFDSALKRVFGDCFVDHRDDKNMMEGRAFYLEKFFDENPHIKALSSHRIYFRDVKDDCFWVYMLRNPLERAGSVYRFEKKQQSNTPGALMAKNLSYQDFVNWYLSPGAPATIRNCQSIFLAANNSHNEGAETMIKALETISSTNCFIGLVERYDESMVVLESLLNERGLNVDLSYTIKNSTKNDGDSLKNNIKGDLLKLFNESNKIDYQLYELVESKLNERIAEISDFRSRMADFRDRCNLLSH